VASLVDVVEACLDRAVEHILSLQRTDGSWEMLPDARIFETALCGYALSHTPGDLDARAVAQAREWAAAATPQSHHPVSHLIEVALRRILLGSGGTIDLTAPELNAPVMASRGTLLYTLALHAGLEVHAPYTEAELRRRVAQEYERSSQASLKLWSKVELISIHILLQSRAGHVAAVETAGFDLVHVQSPTAGFFFNPVSTALAYIALCIAAPGSDPWYLLRARLLQDQQPDGTWRFCSSDVWDTSLIVRSFSSHEWFVREGQQPALDFLQATQSNDGGWPFRSGVESDNDTTGAVMLALRGTLQGERTVDRALAYLARVQMDNGLWRTWQFRDDPPVEDVVAHVLSGLNAYAGRHHIDTAAARSWLVEQVERRKAWAASWYRGVPYAIAEIGSALGFHHPLVRAGVDTLAASQREDGGWGPDLEGPSTASATGLALMAVAKHHPQRVQHALRYLVETQRPDGTWPGTPDMYGPRPLLSHFTTHTQAFVVGGILAVRGRDWLHSDAAAIPAGTPPAIRKETR
jgi:squalene-hopene/tetraprenyl-beta-curcumene cyclase